VEDYSGTSGFTSDAEGANANLDINMSEEAARNLWDVQAAIQRIAADFQTAVRAASDFNSYLISIRETSQTVKMPSLSGMEGGEGGNMAYDGGRVDAPNLGGAGQGEGNMASRIGEMLENSTGAGGGAMGASGSGRANEHPVDVGGFIGQMTTAAWMMQQQGGHQQTAGGRVAAGASAISSGIPAARQFLGGGGLGGAAGLLTRFGAYGAAGYAAYQLVDAGLETYAQSRAMGIAANNSALGTGWGFQQRVGQATMALSPFVSSEDAAQIYNTAVDQGWAGGQNSGRGYDQGNFGQALGFMYNAAKNYGMSPEESSQLLETNSLSAGMSVQALNQQLLTLQQTLDGTGVSTEVATSSFRTLTGALISAGTSPQIAGQIVGGALSGYAGNTALGRGRGAEIAVSTLLSEQGGNIIAGLTGTLPGAVMAGDHAVASTAELQKLTTRFADQVLNMSGLDPEEKAAMFMQLYNGTFNQNITPLEASNMMAENASNKDLLTAGQKKWLDRGRIGKLEHQNWVQSWWQGLDMGGADWAHGITGHTASLKEEEERKYAVNSYDYYNPEVNALLENATDLTKVQLFDAQGNPVQMDGNRVAGANIAKWFSDQANYEKFAKRGSGFYITDEQGNKYDESNIGLGGVDAAALAGNADEANTIYITLSSDAKAWFATNKDKLELDPGYHKQ